MQSRQTQAQPATVERTSVPKQAGDIRAPWACVEPSVWTTPMLTALEQGVKGGKWFSLMDRVYASRNLEAAFTKVRRNRGGAGADHQTALRNVLEPIFEHTFAEHSYGFRPGRCCKDALRRGVRLLDGGHHYVVDADLKSYFDTIAHERLLERAQERVSDGSVLDASGTETQRDRGTPQGGEMTPQTILQIRRHWCIL